MVKPRGRLHLSTRATSTEVRALVDYAICHAGITGFVRRTLNLSEFLRAHDRCATCYRMWSATLDS